MKLISVEVEALPEINFAIQQSDIPLIEAISISNESDTSLENLVLTINSEPEFFPLWQKEIPRIDSKNVVAITEPDLKISSDILLNLTERLKGRLNIRLTDSKLSEIASSSCDVELLAYNEWTGTGIIPEMLSAFILPNSPVVDRILFKSTEIMKEWGDESGLTGYQEKSPAKVLRIAGAVFAAISALELNYSVPPASFEEHGQKVRFPSKILQSSLATCLDLSLFAAACLEQAGLNPIIVFSKGHSFPGLWLKDESFPLNWIDELLPLKKRVELQEICVFETTAVIGSKSDFDSARSIGEKKLNESDFVGFIDIKRCRSHNIKPMPLSFVGNTISLAETVRNTDFKDGRATIAPPTEKQFTFVESSVESRSENRIDQWKRKLLDLTLRNRLLNFKESQKSLRILSPRLGELEDMLADGKEIKIRSIPDNILGGRSRNLILEHTGTDVIGEFLLKEMEQHRLYTNQTDGELTKNLTAIYRESRSSLQEGGANTLFLGAGFLQWYESDSSDVPRIAPIILIPLVISRSSVKDGFRIHQSDDEAQINITLLELLKTDFGVDITSLDPLPVDDHGIDLDKILNTVRRAILNIPRWAVTEDSYIGLFHFQKFLMWKDLESRTDKLMENSIVDHLVSGKENSYPSQGEFPLADELDAKYSLKETYCPLSADSSQLTAVHAAAGGKSFVLHGPPGTGKSQTITNIISHSICSGKTVLFVSEKAAALNVVFSRLSSIGLAPFCLELHSNKSSKAEVLKQLDEGLNVSFNYDDKEWLQRAEDLEGLRQKLNLVPKIVHRKTNPGISFYDGVSKLSSLGDWDAVDLKWPQYTKVSKAELKEIFQIIERLGLLGKEFDTRESKYWEGSKIKDWDPSVQGKIESLSSEVTKKCDELISDFNDIGQKFPGLSTPSSMAELQSLAGYLVNLFKVNFKSSGLIVAPDWEELHVKLQKLADTGKEHFLLKASLSERFKDSLFRLDLPALQQRWNSACKSWWPVSWALKRSLFNEISDSLKDGEILDIEKIETILETAVSVVEKASYLKDQNSFGSDNFPSFWRGEDSDWDLIKGELILIGRIRKAIIDLARKDLVEFKKLSDQTTIFLGVIKDLKLLDPSCDQPSGKFMKKVKCLEQLLADLFDMAVYKFPDQSCDFLNSIRIITGSWVKNINSLRNWCMWNETVDEASEKGLGVLLSRCCGGDSRGDGGGCGRSLELSDMASVFEKSFYKGWTAEVVSKTPELKSFSGTIHNSQIAGFSRLDEKFLGTTRKVVASKLSEKAPKNTAKPVSNSEMGILNREIRKKRRHMPLRVLFKETSKLMPRIKPCFLMSPLSVAQYLSTDHPPFDLVIFDEASQMPVWDAVGAIARGKELIVVGDPKQLPPTSFFSKSESSDWEEHEFVEDLDSILEDCLAAGLPSLYLNWHYRSAHENLIAFSNSHYYGSLLHTFPSAARNGLGLRYIRVEDGVYDKGKTRTNRIEAEQIVGEVVRRLKDPVLRNYSIGIVTFNSSQQILIEDLLDDARRNSPELEEFFNENMEENIFVKNLENVQGDERDVIIFSICYAKDDKGKMSMNFGPLNQSGGERRLNVAITRARREVLVFTSLLPDEIDLSRTRALGVKHLKSYLEFAMGRELASGAYETDAHIGAYESPFVELVGKTIQGKGYTVHPQVGCSGYRIDLAISDERFPEKYILGIETDGVRYNSTKCARERDKLRQAVLEKMGWKLHRIWSTDWWNNPEREIDKVVEKIEEALTEAAEKLAASEVIKRTIVEDVLVAPESVTTDEPVAPEVQLASPISVANVDDESTIEKPYVEWNYSGPSYPAEGFYDDLQKKLVCNLITEIVDFEGPIALVALTRKVCSAFNLSKATKKAIKRVEALASSCKVKSDNFNGEISYWPGDFEISSYMEYRRNTEKVSRIAGEIPSQEVAVAAFSVLESNVSLPMDDLVRATANSFGFTRIGRNVEDAMKAGIKYMDKVHPVVIEDGIVSLE